MEDYTVTTELIQEIDPEIMSVGSKKNKVFVKECKLDITFKNQYGNKLVSMEIDVQDLIPEYTKNKKMILNPDWFNIKTENNVISIISQDDKMICISVHQENNIKTLEIFVRLDRDCMSSISMYHYFKYDERIDEMMDKIIEMYKNNVREKK